MQRTCDREADGDEDGSTESGNEWDSRSERDASDDWDTVGIDSGHDVDDEYGQAGFEEASALQDESQIPLFAGSPLTRLDATLMFLNVCRTHKGTNVYQKCCICLRK